MVSTNANLVTGPMPGWVIKRTASLQNCTIQLRDRRIDLVERLQKFFAPPASPRSETPAHQFHATFLGEQLLLAAEPLAHGQRVQLVAQHGAQAHQLVAMPEQLPEVAFGRCGNPDLWKTFRE